MILSYKYRFQFFVFFLVAIFWAEKRAEAFFFGDDWPVEVEGMGWITNRQLRNTLRILDDSGDGRPFIISRDWIEDASFLLDGEVQQKGYLNPRILIEMEVPADYEDEELRTLSEEWQGLLPDKFQRDFEAERVRYVIDRGVLSFYESVLLEGIPDVLDEDPVSYFFQENALFQGRKSRFFTPSRLQSSENNLITALRQRGYRSARIIERSIEEGEAEGAVRVSIKVEAGPRTFVRKVELRLSKPDQFEREIFEAMPELPKSPIELEDQVYTINWTQDFLNSLRIPFFDRGFPDIRFQTRTIASEQISEERREVDLEILIQKGPPVRVGEIIFRGTEPTRDQTLRRQLRLEEGDPLNIFRAQDGRDGLGRLNIFRIVRLNYEQTEDPLIRNVIYETTQIPRNEINLIMGLGTYEILRGGFEITQNNIWRRAHQGRLRAIQSFKSTFVDYDYSVPDLFGENIRGFINPSYLRRDEIAFTRETSRIGTGLEYFFRNARTTVRAQYSFERQRAFNLPTERKVRNLRSSFDIASIQFSAERNTIENPIQPTGGNKTFLRYKIASDLLGGSLNYHKISVGQTFHFRIGRGRFLHTRLQHGIIGSFQDSEINIPLTERTFLGGESSVRGFRQNRVSPRDEDNELIGAESFVLANIQLEQRILESVSVNLFLDGAGFAADLSNYPFNESVLSTGLGLSYNTVLGPLRMEYAYNIVRRDADGRGAFQIALGFPF